MARSLVMNEPAVRLRPWLWPRHKTLMRGVDWAEAALLVTVIVLGLILLPVSLAAGSEVYAHQDAVSRQQSSTHHEVTATLLDDAAPTSVGTRGEVVTGTSKVRARWNLPDGTERVGTLKADNGTTAGHQVRLWLDGSGNPVDPPVTQDAAVMAGVATVLGIWTVAGLTVGVLLVGARAGMNWYRSARWQRTWAQIEPGWTRTV
jgi:hypothetical protein